MRFSDSIPAANTTIRLVQASSIRSRMVTDPTASGQQRTKEAYFRTVGELERATTDKERKRIVKETGVKGSSQLLRLPSVALPGSILIEAAHGLKAIVGGIVSAMLGEKKSADRDSVGDDEDPDDEEEDMRYSVLCCVCNVNAYSRLPALSPGSAWTRCGSPANSEKKATGSMARFADPTACWPTSASPLPHMVRACVCPNELAVSSRTVAQSRPARSVLQDLRLCQVRPGVRQGRSAGNGGLRWCAARYPYTPARLPGRVLPGCGPVTA